MPLSLFALAMVGCTIRDVDSPIGKAADANLAGKITIDGSSTVYPVTQAVVEEFMRRHPRVAISVGIAGTGGGFKRFVGDELDICDASRPIEKEEIAACRADGVDFLEFRIALDGISVVVNSQNTWCKSLTVAQLKRLWEPGSALKMWSDLNPEFPNRRIILYGPDADSGTFDYFSEAVCGKRGASRTDYTPSSNDNVLIQGVEGDVGALGYFGYAYFALNATQLKAIRIAPDDRTPGVAPTDETILNRTYTPLSRPLLLYVNRKALQRPEMAAFLSYYLERGAELARAVHSIPFPPEHYAECRDRLRAEINNP
jgi:phosphate transport system substrate-binding protein